MPLLNRKVTTKNHRRDPLWSIKKAILALLVEGQMCLSDITLTIHEPTVRTKEALQQMRVLDIIEIRKTAEGNEKFEVWGISKPSFFRAISSLFQRRQDISKFLEE